MGRGGPPPRRGRGPGPRGAGHRLRQLPVGPHARPRLDRSHRPFDRRPRAGTDGRRRRRLAPRCARPFDPGGVGGARHARRRRSTLRRLRGARAQRPRVRALPHGASGPDVGPGHRSGGRTGAGRDVRSTRVQPGESPPSDDRRDRARTRPRSGTAAATRRVRRGRRRPTTGQRRPGAGRDRDRRRRRGHRRGGRRRTDRRTRRTAVARRRCRRRVSVRGLRARGHRLRGHRHEPEARRALVRAPREQGRHRAGRPARGPRRPHRRPARRGRRSAGRSPDRRRVRRRSPRLGHGLRLTAHARPRRAPGQRVRRRPSQRVVGRHVQPRGAVRAGYRAPRTERCGSSRARAADHPPGRARRHPGDRDPRRGPGLRGRGRRGDGPRSRGRTGRSRRRPVHPGPHRDPRGVARTRALRIRRSPDPRRHGHRTGGAADDRLRSPGCPGVLGPAGDRDEPSPGRPGRAGPLRPGAVHATRLRARRIGRARPPRDGPALRSGRRDARRSSRRHRRSTPVE